jgi:redox-sensitive bicupin YhaK (pirin superfamily)
MSNIKLIIEERAASIGSFMVGRLLPFRQKRSVGPFVFIDHMGPADLKDYENLDVPPHPHIGLSTLTYLFEGAIMHKDSIGSEVEITPGAVNWMSAGRGVVHSERTPERLRNTDKKLHGLQIWVAMPKALEESQPSFAHVEENEIPYVEVKGVNVKVIAGEFNGVQSPVPVHSKLYFLEIKSGEHNTEVNLSDYLFGESALYILEGKVSSEGHEFGSKQLLVANDSKLCSFEMEANTTIYIFGGEPFPEERFIFWNFVSSDKVLLEKAKDDWRNQNFPKVPGEKDFVPLP